MNTQTTNSEMQMTGGIKTKKIVKYNKTDKEYKDKCGTMRRVYERNGMTYIRKKSKKNGKFGYHKVKVN